MPLVHTSAIATRGYRAGAYAVATRGLLVLPDIVARFAVRAEVQEAAAFWTVTVEQDLSANVGMQGSMSAAVDDALQTLHVAEVRTVADRWWGQIDAQEPLSARLKAEDWRAQVVDHELGARLQQVSYGAGSVEDTDGSGSVAVTVTQGMTQDDAHPS